MTAAVLNKKVLIELAIAGLRAQRKAWVEAEKRRPKTKKKKENKL